jgi:hypothetical protein
MILIGKKIKILPRINADDRGSGKEQNLTTDKHGQDGSARIGNMEIGRKPQSAKGQKRRELCPQTKGQRLMAKSQEPQSS